jgi:glycosyltransferase involved in cell wall biosynthesis
LTEFLVHPEPVGIPVVMVVSRLLYDKGIREFIDAVRLLKSKSIDFRAILVGAVDANPNSIEERELNSWVEDGIVEHLGFRNDVSNIISMANIIVLPSYREGLPKCLIEAAACGRAVITTDVPGCRDAITPGLTGILVPVKNVPELADAINMLLHDEKKRSSMAMEGRKLAEAAFDIQMVVESHLHIYKSVI